MRVDRTEGAQCPRKPRWARTGGRRPHWILPVRRVRRRAIVGPVYYLTRSADRCGVRHMDAARTRRSSLTPHIGCRANDCVTTQHRSEQTEAGRSPQGTDESCGVGGSPVGHLDEHVPFQVRDGQDAGVPSRCPVAPYVHCRLPSTHRTPPRTRRPRAVLQRRSWRSHRGPAWTGPHFHGS
jgi:hypothetical protein